MANNDNNILRELENAVENRQKIESEINNILNESDCVLVKAESQLKGISNNDTFTKIEKDIENSSESSYALSIEVSRDLFKEFDNEHNISAIHPPSDDISSTQLPDDVIEEMKNSSQEENKLTEEKDDSTLKNNESMGPSLEITITNDAEDDIEENVLETTLLKNSSTFMGCSKEFASTGVEKIITVIFDVDKERSVSTSSNEYNKQEENPIKETADILLDKPSNDAAKNIINVDINSNESTNPSKDQKISLKRPNEENHQSEVAKKLKFDELTKSNETNLDQSQTEYTHVIFDPDETADANDPKWSEFNNNFSIEEHFQSVRNQWRSMALPNPHKNLTTRFVPENRKFKSDTCVNTENEYASMSCVQYLDNKINGYTQKVNDLYVRLNYLPLSNRGRSQRNKILREIDELQKFVIEIVKNREEIQQNFMFYQHPNNTWNANYLTRTQLDELKEQEKLLEFQKRFYSR